MPLSDKSKNLLRNYKDTPLVGLVNRTSKQIELAPCISPRVWMECNKEGKAISAERIDSNFSTIGACNEEDLNHFNDLLAKGYVPRLVSNEGEFEEKSAHELLLNQINVTEKKANWGGFSVEISSAGDIEYAFSSGAFNSERGEKRTKGAQLAQEFQNEVTTQINAFCVQENLIKNIEPPVITIPERSSRAVDTIETTPVKRTRTEDVMTTPKRPSTSSNHVETRFTTPPRMSSTTRSSSETQLMFFTPLGRQTSSTSSSNITSPLIGSVENNRPTLS